MLACTWSSATLATTARPAEMSPLAPPPSAPATMKPSREAFTVAACPAADSVESVREAST